MSRNTFEKLWSATTLALILAMLVAPFASAQVTTDQADYAPGSVVTISGDFRSPAANQANGKPRLTLLDVPLGSRAKIGDPANQGFSPGNDLNISLPGLEQLQAYGLVSGYWVRVLQRSPVIVLQIDHLELAMEKELADLVQVEEICPSR